LKTLFDEEKMKTYTRASPSLGDSITIASITITQPLQSADLVTFRSKMKLAPVRFHFRKHTVDNLGLTSLTFAFFLKMSQLAATTILTRAWPLQL
jgi:hypothetical protein